MPTRRTLIAAGLSVVGLFLTVAKGSAAPTKPIVVTVLGDSITAGLGLPAAEALPAQLGDALGALGVKADVRGAGVSGDTTAGGLARLDFSVQPDTAVCVVELGANDYLQSVPPRDIQANLNAIVARLKMRRIRVVLAAGRAPRAEAGAYGREFDAVYRDVARKQGVILAPDLLAGLMDRPGFRQADGAHPNAAGVKIMASRLAPLVARAIAIR
jgi:acyl-CoA thioesterase-1